MASHRVSRNGDEHSQCVCPVEGGSEGGLPTAPISKQPHHHSSGLQIARRMAIGSAGSDAAPNSPTGGYSSLRALHRCMGQAVAVRRHYLLRCAALRLLRLSGVGFRSYISERVISKHRLMEGPRSAPCVCAVLFTASSSSSTTVARANARTHACMPCLCCVQPILDSVTLVDCCWQQHTCIAAAVQAAASHSLTPTLRSIRRRWRLRAAVIHHRSTPRTHTHRHAHAILYMHTSIHRAPPA